MNQDSVVQFIGGIFSAVAVQFVRRMAREARAKRREQTEVAKLEIEAEQDDKQRLWERVAALEGRVTALEHERTELLLKVAEKDGIIAARDNKIRELKSDVEVLEETVRAQEATIKRLQEQVQGRVARA